MERIQCRHCAKIPIPDASYASVLLTGSTAKLNASVEHLESDSKTPGLTAICPKCGRRTALVANPCDVGAFEHVLALARRVGLFLK